MKKDEIPKELPLTIQALLLVKDTGLDQGTIECPKCKGVLRYAVAKNGHTRGHCKTENCLSWVE